jgi:cytochrome c-type biogenesis protein CcmF
MIVLLTVSFGLVIYRMPMLRARNELDSWASREAAFLVNNWVLLFCAFFVLFATMFPTLSEALRGERLTMGPEFFNRWMTPVGLILLMLTGIGPLLAWRKSSIDNMRHQFLWPVGTGLATGAGLRALGVEIWPAGLCFALCAMVTTTILQEFVRGALVRRDATGTDLFTSLVGLFARSKRRYGGYVVHLGIVLVFLGFGGNAFQREEQIELMPGQQVAIAPYVVRYDRLSITDDGQKQMVTAHVDVTRKGASVGSLYPARWFFRNRESEPTTEVALRRSPTDDLYVVLAAYDPSTQAATFKIDVNPLVNWIWLGVGIMVVGTIIAWLPERALAFATRTVPEGAATTTMILLLFALGAAKPLFAQHVEGAVTVAIVPKTPVERELQSHLVCMCGNCGRKRIGECTCPDAGRMQQELHDLITAGKSYDEIVQHFVSKYGSQEVLASPINTGFNRLAWLLPYAAGGLGIVVIGAMAVRWTRRDDEPTPAPPVTSAAAPELENRLDDELRDLD